jgi:hypothetical protein
MAEIEVRPFIMRNAIIVFGAADDFAKAVSTAAIAPAGGTAEFKGLKPSAVFTFPQASTYVLELTYAQDWSASTSLSRYLWEHKGETVPFILNPDDTTGQTGVGSTSWAGTVAIVPGQVGGDVDSVATASVSLGIVGEPTPTFTPGGAELDAPPLEGDEEFITEAEDAGHEVAASFSGDTPPAPARRRATAAA